MRIRASSVRLCLVTLIISLGLSAVASAAPKVKWTTDKFSGQKTAKMGLESFGLGLDNSVAIDLYGVAPAKRYFIRVEYTGKGWLFIPPGETLYLKADDRLIPFSGDGSTDSRTTIDLDPYGYQRNEYQGNNSPIRVREVAVYELTADQIRTLAAASQIQYRVAGKNGTLTSSTSANSYLKAFLSQAVPVIEAAPDSGASSGR